MEEKKKKEKGQEGRKVTRRSRTKKMSASQGLGEEEAVGNSSFDLSAMCPATTPPFAECASRAQEAPRHVLPPTVIT